MPNRTSVAVVSAADTDLVSRLAALTHAPVVRQFHDLYGDAEELRRFRPQAVYLGAPEVGQEDAGAIRMLGAILPDTTLVLVCAGENEARLLPWAERLDATLLVEPYSSGELARSLDAALAAGSRSSTEALLDFARGLSDEINNPLQMVSGYLRLVEDALEREGQEASLQQVRLVQRGLDRIRGTMAKIQWLSRAADHRRGLHTCDLAELLPAALERAGDGRLPSLQRSTPGAVPVCGDRDLIAALLDHLCRATVALVDAGAEVRVELDGSERSGCINVWLESARLPAWRLPRTFEPYYLSRVLKGTPEGLSLFLVQAIAQSHGGRALARWEEGGGVTLHVELPGV